MSVKEWVQYLKLPVDYCDLLIEEGYDDIEFLNDLAESDLTDMGITKRGHIKRIMKFVDNYDEELKIFDRRNELGVVNPIPKIPEIPSKEIPEEVINKKVKKPSKITKITKKLRNMKIQTIASKINDDPDSYSDIPQEIMKNEVCKQLFYFVKKCVVLLESGFTEKFLTWSFHPVDQQTLKILNYQPSEMNTKFEEGETNISKNQMLQLLRSFLECSKNWILGDYVVECADLVDENGTHESFFKDRYGGKFAATYKMGETELTDSQEQKEIPMKIHFRYFRGKWYLTNFA